MPRIWVANQWLDPSEECGGLPHDYCADCYDDAKHDWWDRCEEAWENDEFVMADDEDIYTIVVDDDEHPDYDDFGDYVCLECGKTLKEEVDG